jgi:4-hydroxy-tetrahydrodipicolinate reductase
MIRLALLGATGRMGRRVLDLLENDRRFELVAALAHRDDPAFGAAVGGPERSIVVSDTCDAPFDALLDFSIPAGTMAWLDQCVSRRAAMVIGATGHSEPQLKQISAAAGSIALLKASNFSVGVNLMLKVVADVANRLGDDYDIEIIEHHHAKKIDAPSGTAAALTDAIVESTGRDKSRDLVYGRHGETGMRPKRQIGVHAVRMGETVGHHEVHFSGPGETLTVRHTAHSRDTFARGALEAAAWIHNKPPGRYAMSDVLGITE